MFAGAKRHSSNIRVMQLFHELKQQFPAVPDHVVTACIANYVQKGLSTDSTVQRKSIQEVLQASLATEDQQEPMGQQAVNPVDSKVALMSNPNAQTSFSSDTIEENYPCDANSFSQSNSSASDTKPKKLSKKVKQKSEGSQNLNELSRPGMNESDDSNRSIVNNPSAFYSKNPESVSVNYSNSGGEEIRNKFGNSSFFIQRPTHLDIKLDESADSSPNLTNKSNVNIRPSERCFDIQKLLQSEHSDCKPPRSPLSTKRFLKNSPNKSDFSPETKKSPLSPKFNRINNSKVSTSSGTRNSNLPSPSIDICASITQSDPKDSFSHSEKVDPNPQKCSQISENSTPLIESSASVNLSVKVDCSMGLLQSPSRPRRSSALSLTPELPWCTPEPPSQRSYTSVNLTLRPPTSEPQAPIDITSRNSSLTYSTSSFDSQKGLQSRLQITVGPSGGTVSSVRTRPRSSYIPQDNSQESVPTRAGSLPDLTSKEQSSVIIKQQVRIDRLRIELITEKGRLIAMQKEVAELENPCTIAVATKVDLELEKQLLKEIKHLRGQCERLVFEVEGQYETRVPLGETNEEFYRNIYTGQRGPLLTDRPLSNRRLQYQGPSPVTFSEVDGSKWNCPVCTFQNHPLLNKCEQCEMPRILHGPRKSNPQVCSPSNSFSRHFSDSGPQTASTSHINMTTQPHSFPYFPISNNLPMSLSHQRSPNYGCIAAVNPNVNFLQNKRL